MQFRALEIPAGLSVRPSMASDNAFLELLYKSTREDLEMVDGTVDLIESLKEHQYLAQTEGYGHQFPNAMYFIIEYHQESVGRVVLDFGSEEIRLVDLAFIKAARGKGLATGVIRSFISCADQVRAPLTLSVLETNVQAKLLYAKLGFVVELVQPPRCMMIYHPKAVTG